MKKNNILITALMTAAVFTSCSLFLSSDNYDDYTWDGTAYTDADSDGIPDVAEEEGTSFYGMPLYDWGARPGIPDLFIHVVPMVAGLDSNGYPDGGMLLQKKALDRVVSAFAAQGIAVHFDVGKRRLYEGYGEILNRNSATYNMSDKDHSIAYTKSITLTNFPGTDSSFTFVDDVKSSVLPSERNQIFYFLVIGSSQEADGSGGSSGIAWSPGRDFLMTLGNWGLGFGTNAGLGLTYENFENQVVNRQASTIMHEFGHNLGLGHGGFESMNYKPNYISIMNYLYQLTGLPRIGTSEGDRYYYERYYQSNNSSSVWKDFIVKSFPPNLYEFDLLDSAFSSTFRMDFSHGVGGVLNENDLDESAGLKQTGSNAVDWNGSGSASDVSFSENINPSYDGALSTAMSDYNDWGNLYFYYNDHHSGISRTLEDQDREVIIEYDAPRSVIPFQRSE